MAVAHRGLRRRAVHNLIHRVNPFPFAGTATQYKDFGDQVKVRVAGVVLPVAMLKLAVVPPEAN